MDEMVVLIYDAPETTRVPLAIRSGWIRSLYPTVRVIEAWDGPTQVGYTPERMKAHEYYVISTLGITGITHFYSSEPYGAHMSQALGAVDRRVDEARIRVPVSATAIRADPFASREFVDPRVYRDLIVNVVFLGAPCSGKTTLAERMAKEFNTSWMPEYGRTYWEEHQVERRLSLAQLVEIAEGHVEREEQCLRQANRVLFSDTNALTTATFSRYYHGVVPDRLAELAARCSSRYDVVFVCDIDIPYDDTWDRSGKVKREAFQRQVLEDLAGMKIPHYLLHGTLEERVVAVRQVLSRFQKYMNPLELSGSPLP